MINHPRDVNLQLYVVENLSRFWFLIVALLYVPGYAAKFAVGNPHPLIVYVTSTAAEVAVENVFGQSLSSSRI